MAYGFGPTYGTGTTDAIRTTVPVTTLVDQSAILMAARGYVASTGGGGSGGIVSLVDASNVLLVLGSLVNAAGQIQREGSTDAFAVTANNTVAPIPGRFNYSGGYTPLATSPLRVAVNSALPAGQIAGAGPLTGAAHVLIGNRTSPEAHWDGLIDEVAVWIGGGGFSTTGLYAAFERRVFLGYPLYDLGPGDGTLVFYADGRAQVNLIDGQPLTFTGAKTYLTRPVEYLSTDLIPIRSSSMVRGAGDAACGWPQMSRACGVR